MTSLAPQAKFRAFDTNGNPLSGGKLYTYAAGTTTPLVTYKDAANTVNTNPIILDQYGQCDLWFGTSSYKLLLKDSADVTQPGWPVDNVSTLEGLIASSTAMVVKTVATFASLATTQANIGDTINVLGYSYPALGGGLFDVVSSSGLSNIDGIVQINGSIAFYRREASYHLFNAIDVTWFGGQSTNDDTASLQKAINYAISRASGLTSGGSTAEPNYKTVAYIAIKFRSGNWNFKTGTPVYIPYSTSKPNITLQGETGTNIIGNGSNVFLDSTGGGCYKNKFINIVFTQFVTCLKIDTGNKNESKIQFIDCQSLNIDTFVDTISYNSIRSTLISFKECFFGDTRRIINSYADHLTFKDCWFYAKHASTDALFYLSGDGMVKFDSSFFIPHGAQVSPVSQARWIDFICDKDNGTETDRSLKTLIVSNCRASLESARPFIWFFDNSISSPNGNNQVSSITVEDSYIGGTGGYAVVNYKQGYPGSVNFRNTKVLSCSEICSIDAGNTNPPIPSNLTSITSHVIMIDEATRLSQTNSYNSASLVSPALEPFCYDTTTQTSKFKRSIPKNIDYRLPCVAGAANKVKCTIPVFFDHINAAHNRDLLSFMVTCVSDIGLSAATGRAIFTGIVSMVAGQQSGVDTKSLVLTTISDAMGGINFATSSSPTIYFGSGNSGSSTIISNSNSGTEDNITITFAGNAPSVCWVYILPLAGIRENQADKRQYGVW